MKWDILTVLVLLTSCTKKHQQVLAYVINENNIKDTLTKIESINQKGFRRKKKTPLNQFTTTTSQKRSNNNNCFGRRQVLSIFILSGALPCSAKEVEDKKKGTIAKDIYGSSIIASLASSKSGNDRTMMIMGLKSDPTYLLINSSSKEFEPFALNAECTHLGCVVPWSEFENKFVCPCHGSQYDKMGLVLRGPAPHPLVLAHVELDQDDHLVLTKWMEEDFRTNEKPWWS